MNLKQLQHTQDIYNRIVELDESIKYIGSKASQLAEKEQIVKLSLEFESQITEVKGEEDEAFEAMIEGLGPLAQFLKKKAPAKEKVEGISFSLTDTETLEVFAILLHIKNEQRKKLIQQLSDLGFETTK